MKKFLALIFVMFSIAGLASATAVDSFTISQSSIKISNGHTPTYISADNLSLSYNGQSIILKSGQVTYTEAYNRVAYPAHTSINDLMAKLDSLGAIARKNWTFVHKSANDSTQLKAGGGMLHCITINTKGASSNQIKIWDGTTLIAVIDGTSATTTYLYDIHFSVGLRIKSVTGTCSDYTVVYR